MERGHFVVLSISYPSAAEFEVRITGHGDRAPIPMSTKEEVLRNREELPPADQMTDCSVDSTVAAWTRFCKTRQAPNGPLQWHFDKTNLYIRMVKLECYNRNTKSKCQRGYVRDGVEVYNIENQFGVSVKVTNCRGCRVKTTYKGVRYYDVADSKPRNPIPRVTGSVRPIPNFGKTTKNVCAAPGARPSVGVCIGGTAPGAPIMPPPNNPVVVIPPAPPVEQPQPVPPPPAITIPVPGDFRKSWQSVRDLLIFLKTLFSFLLFIDLSDQT